MQFRPTDHVGVEDGGVLQRHCDFRPHPASQNPVAHPHLVPHLGRDDDLRAKFHVSQVGVGKQPVQRPRDVQRRAIAVDPQVGREETRTEGDLNLRPVREPDEGFVKP